MTDSWRKEKEVKKKSCTRAWCGVLAAALVVTSTSSVMLAEAAKAPKLNKKTITLRAGAKKKLKVKNLKKKQKVKWKSSKKKIATVSKKGLVRAKRIGITKIVAKVGKKKLVCHVRVLPKKIVIRRPKPMPVATPVRVVTPKPTAIVQPSETTNVSPTMDVTAKPTIAPTVKPTMVPTVKPTTAPTATPTASPSSAPTATQTAKPSATPTATPTVKPTATPTVKPTATPSGNAGQNVNLNGKKAFTIAGYQLALGLTRDEVNTVLGSLKTDVKRTAKSPQGFDVIAFRAGGNDTDKSFDEKYSTYILIYLKDDIVVGISGNASSMNFDGTVSYGTSAATLVSNGWVDVDWYKTTAGNAAAYSKDVDNATIIAFADAYGDDKVYSIQIFNNAYSIADMTKCRETTLPMNYSADVLTEMETETFEILNAYLVNTGVRAVDDKALRKNTKVSNVARAYSKEIADEGCIDAANAERKLALSKEALENAGLSFNNWGGRIMIGNMDAIGFANSVIESNDARNTLISANYAICGIGASVYTESAGKAVYYPNMVIDFVDRVSAL